MHLLAMGGICGVLAAVNKVHLLGIIEFVALAVLIAGLVGWARITLKVHTHAQVYMGFTLGFLLHFVFVNLGLYL
jgi:membrane-associated phospholipid phosphatase